MGRIIFLMVFLCIWLLMEFHLFRSFRYYFTPGSKGMMVFTILWWIIPVFTFAAFFFIRQLSPNVQVWFMNLLGILFISKLLAWVFILLGETGFLAARMMKENTQEMIESRRKFIFNIGLFTMLAPMGTMIYGMLKTAKDFKIHNHRLGFKNLPKAFHGLKLVQISDIHTGSILDADALEKAVQMVNALKPDIIVFTGDLVNNITAEALPFENTLRQFSAPLGVYSILGNHDYGDYYRWPDIEGKRKNMEEMIALHQRMNWKLMLNTHEIFEREGEKIVLMGVENWGSALRFPKYGKLDQSKIGTEEIPFKILLSHDPSHWDTAIRGKEKDIDLTLSGHTHGFQFGVEIPGFKWSPSQYVYKQWAGIYKDGNQVINVNRGLGCIGYSGRVGIRPEITLITLETA